MSRSPPKCGIVPKRDDDQYGAVIFLGTNFQLQGCRGPGTAHNVSGPYHCQKFFFRSVTQARKLTLALIPLVTREG